MERKNLLDDEQQDFQPSKFDTSVVVDLVDAIENGENIGIVMMWL